VAPEVSVWDSVFPRVIDIISSRLRRTAGSTTLQPWTFTGPASDSGWVRMIEHLRPVLRARDVVASDTTFDRLEFDRLWSLNDSTVAVSVTWRNTSICPDQRRTGWSTAYRIEIKRRGTPRQPFWTDSRLLPLVHGDGIRCHVR
jgi:hypothetical protein